MENRKIRLAKFVGSGKAPQPKLETVTLAPIAWPKLTPLVIRGALSSKYWRQLRELQTRLERDGTIRSCLDSLEKAGTDRRYVLRLLSIEVRTQGKGFDVLKDLRTENRTLRSLARRLRGLVGEIEGVYDIRCGRYATFLRGMMQFTLKFPVLPPSKPIPLGLMREMRALADDIECEARRVGVMLRRGHAPDLLNRYFVFSLLLHVHQTTGDARRHLLTLSDMLSCAYGEVGVKKRVSFDSLDKLLTRHVLPALIRQFPNTK